MDNKRDDDGLPLRPVLPFIFTVSPLQFQSGCAGTPHRGGSISPLNLLCSSVHLQPGHWSLTEIYCHASIRGCSSSSVSPLPRLALQSRWLSFVGSGQPLLLLPRAYVESRVAKLPSIYSLQWFELFMWNYLCCAAHMMSFLRLDRDRGSELTVGMDCMYGKCRDGALLVL